MQLDIWELFQLLKKYLARNYDMPAYQGDTIGAFDRKFVLVCSSRIPWTRRQLACKVMWNKKTYKGFTQTFRNLYHEKGGFRALYRGYMWRYGNIFLDFMLFNTLMRATAPIFFLIWFDTTSDDVLFRFGKEEKHTVITRSLNTQTHTSAYIIYITKNIQRTFQSTI